MQETKFKILLIVLIYNCLCLNSCIEAKESKSTQDWINDSLKSVDNIPKSKGANSNAVKLMPFVPGRLLPHKDELKQVSPQIDSNLLQGEVSLSTPPPTKAKINQWRVKKRYDATNNIVNNTANNDTVKTQTNYSQIKTIAGKACNKIITSIITNSENTDLPITQANNENDTANLNLSNQFRLNSQGLTNNLDALNSPESTNNDSEFAAGPPPFPLNLIPAPMLKQLIYNKTSAKTAYRSPQASYFGSWHQGSQTAANYNTSKFYDSIAKSNLPPCSFHSNLTTIAYNRSNSIKYNWPIYRSIPYNRTRAVLNYNNLVPVYSKPSKNNNYHPYVACYPPYAHYSRFE